MKRMLLIFLVALFVGHAPWRLMNLAVRSFTMHYTELHVDMGTNKYWDALDLEARLTAMHYTVTYEKKPVIPIGFMGALQRVYGFTDYDEHRIVIDENLSWNERFNTLAHEGGHLLQPGWLTGRQKDAFAESVSYLVAGNVREHARYLSSTKVDTLLVLITEWRAIYHAAAVLEDR